MYPDCGYMVADALREMVRLATEPYDPAKAGDVAKALAEAKIALAFWDAEKALDEHRKRNPRNTPRTSPR